MENTFERRLNPRVEVEWPIHIYVDKESFEGELRNLSVEGLYISCDEPLRIHSTYRMSILPPHHPLIDVKGRIIWSDLYGLDGDKRLYGLGICLIDIKEKDKQYIKELMEEYA